LASIEALVFTSVCCGGAVHSPSQTCVLNLASLRPLYRARNFLMPTPTMTPRTEEDEYGEDPRFDDTDVSTIPFVQHPAYGRGLWKNPIKFVSAAPDAPIKAPVGNTMAEKYLAIMFPNGQPQPKSEAYPACGICGESVKEQDQRMHFLSPAHQAALPRAPIPSAIDRSRMGLKYMSKHGFDVDARVGLGVSGQGMLFPLVPKEKRDKFGLGIDKKEHEKKRALGGASIADVKEGRLDAGKIRKLATVERRKHDKLQKMFYGNDEVEKYLGHLDG
jgi:hypothetical protein